MEAEVQLRENVDGTNKKKLIKRLSLIPKI